jgi:hypothetical protein
MMATVYGGHKSSTYHTFTPTRTNISLTTPKNPSRSKSHTPPSDSVKALPPKKEATNQIDQRQAPLSLSAPGNAEHSPSLVIASSRKSVVNDTEDLQVWWERFLEKHESDICMVISPLKFVCSCTHIRTGVS